MELVINKLKIQTPMDVIIKQLRFETGNYYFNDIVVRKNNLVVSCPFHKNGKEKHASCSINTDMTGDLVYGTFHCWSCGTSGQLYEIVNRCFNQTGNFGKQWLADNFGNIFVETVEYLPEIVLDSKPENSQILSSSILSKFEYSNPQALDYLINKRHLTKEVIDYFKLGFDTSTSDITFPLWDSKGNLVGILRRNIYTKKFSIPNIELKPIYLLNYIKELNYTTVYVVESQINALTLWGYGRPAVALLGTGSKAQYDMLNSSGIRTLYLCFDGDLAGKHGALNMIKHLNDNVFINVVVLPEGKDVNDLTEEEFNSLPVYDSVEYIKYFS